MSDTIAWVAGSALASSILALIALAKFWMDVGATKLQARQAASKSEMAITDLANFKTVVAEKYVLQGALSASESRLTSSIDRLTERIDSLLNMVQQGRHG